MEADMQRFFGTDLRDLWRPGGGRSQLTLRRLWVLLRGLPRESALAIDDNGGTMPFDIADHLLADTWVLLAGVNSSKGKGPKDHPIREKQRTKITAAKGRSRRTTYERKLAANQRRIAGRTTT